MNLAVGARLPLRGVALRCVALGHVAVAVAVNVNVNVKVNAHVNERGGLPFLSGPGVAVPLDSGRRWTDDARLDGLDALMSVWWRVLLGRGEPVRTNVDALLGEVASVVKRIDNDRGEGQVMLDGMEWTARSLDDQPIPAGARVRVVSIEGVKLIVETDDG